MANNILTPVSERELTEAQRIVQKLSIFALVRTILSSERSLLSWMRTVVGLFTFGFSLEKFTDYVGRGQEETEFFDGPRILALSLVCIGLLAIVLALVMHKKRERRMTQLGLPPTSRFCLATTGAAALFAIGIATLIGIVLN